MKDLKSVGIVTINDYSNYGNRLQNYAVQQVLRSLGCHATTIVNKPTPATSESVIQKLREMSVGTIIRKACERISRFRTRNLIARRTEACRRFTSENIVETPFCITEGQVPKDLGERFEHFVVGSDQVWNPIFRKGSSIDFLTFAPPSKRVAYAASFGITKIPERFVPQYREWLSGIAHISVREDSGFRIVRQLTGKEPVVLIDPTLMLTEQQWSIILTPANLKPRSEYLLTYFLGDVDRQRNQAIYKIASAHGLDVVHLASLRDTTRYAISPGEFLDYIWSAKIVLTDSFHGAIFSILFETPFVVFERVGREPSMGSRFDTLLKRFGLESRKWPDLSPRSAIETDYTGVRSVLEHERAKALDFLSIALSL